MHCFTPLRGPCDIERVKKIVKKMENLIDRRYC